MELFVIFGYPFIEWNESFVNIPFCVEESHMCVMIWGWAHGDNFHFGLAISLNVLHLIMMIIKSSYICNKKINKIKTYHNIFKIVHVASPPSTALLNHKTCPKYFHYNEESSWHSLMHNKRDTYDINYHNITCDLTLEISENKKGMTLTIPPDWKKHISQDNVDIS